MGLDDAFEALKENMSLLQSAAAEKWDEVRATAEDKWPEVADAVSEKGSEVKDLLQEKGGELKDAIKDLPHVVAEKWQPVQDTVMEKWPEVRETVVDKGVELKELVEHKWPEVQDFVEERVDRHWPTVQAKVEETFPGLQATLAHKWALGRELMGRPGLSRPSAKPLSADVDAEGDAPVQSPATATDEEERADAPEPPPSPPAAETVAEERSEETELPEFRDLYYADSLPQRRTKRSHTLDPTALPSPPPSKGSFRLKSKKNPALRNPELVVEAPKKGPGVLRLMVAVPLLAAAGVQVFQSVTSHLDQVNLYRKHVINLEQQLREARAQPPANLEALRKVDAMGHQLASAGKQLDESDRQLRGFGLASPRKKGLRPADSEIAEQISELTNQLIEMKAEHAKALKAKDAELAEQTEIARRVRRAVTDATAALADKCKDCDALTDKNLALEAAAAAHAAALNKALAAAKTGAAPEADAADLSSELEQSFAANSVLREQLQTTTALLRDSVAHCEGLEDEKTAAIQARDVEVEALKADAALSAQRAADAEAKVAALQAALAASARMAAAAPTGDASGDTAAVAPAATDTGSMGAGVGGVSKGPAVDTWSQWMSGLMIPSISSPRSTEATA